MPKPKYIALLAEELEEYRAHSFQLWALRNPSIDLSG